MAGVEQLAAGHIADQVALADAASAGAGDLWKNVDPGRIVSSWTGLVGQAMVELTAAQLAAARQADSYVDSALDVQGVNASSAGQVAAYRLSGIASDGRGLDTLLQEPMIGALLGIRGGASPDEALAAGLVQLDMIVRTQVADAGRVSDGLAIAARRHSGGYTRMLTPPSCPRCAILAGNWYRWNAGFRRHPRCDCRSIPASEDAAGDLTTSPRAYFDGLATAEQDRLFTRAGAQAIRDGADINQVVNARRGMYTAGGRQLTRESTTRRGSSPGARLMPEQIYVEAGGNREQAITLLRRFGYLT